MFFKKPQKTADICLVLEGTYPYVRGGVSGWAHNLILNQPDLTFHLVTILAPPYQTQQYYKIPDNVLSITDIRLQDVPQGSSVKKSDHEIFDEIEDVLTKFHESATLDDFKRLIDLFNGKNKRLGRNALLESHQAWNMIQRMYQRHFSGGSFLDYFWSWRNLFGGLLSVILADIPSARVYHTLCTGYAGIYAACASQQTGSPMLLTEHGLYTNERRIELGTAEWFHSVEKQNLCLNSNHIELRDFWENAFASYSKISYQAADKIVSLFKENSDVQREEGAAPEKQLVIPNGVDIDKFDSCSPKSDSPLVIGLIGRIVPIKDTKCFIQAAQIILSKYPDALMLIIGPTEEDPRYVDECREMVEQFGLSQSILFTGSVNINKFLEEINVLVLTSLSEAQPLVILEAGAASIPVVATDVGSCRELIMGATDENPSFGPGGFVAQVSDADDVAEKVCRLLSDKGMRERYGRSLRSRVRAFYSSATQHEAYRNLYRELLEQSEDTEVKDVA